MQIGSRAIRVLVSWAIALAITAAASGQTQPQPAAAPTLTCSVLNETPREREPIRISNLKRVLVRAALIAPPATVDPLRLRAPGAPPQDGNLAVIVRRIAAGRPMVATRPIVIAQATETNRQSLDVSLEIPIDAATRRANIERFLERLGRESTAAGKGEVFQRLAQDHATAVATFERMYMENLVGDFEVACAYASHERGTWNGDLESPAPNPIQVFFESAFFDQREFR